LNVYMLFVLEKAYISFFNKSYQEN
jgi:hypothetical protein